jgi:microcystin degradation protein MlrC
MPIFNHMYPKILMFLAILMLPLFTGSCSQKDQKLRIFMRGIRHESNTFSTLQTTGENFTVEKGSEVFKGKLWARYPEKTQKKAEKLVMRLWDVRKKLDFDAPVAPIDKAIQQALELDTLEKTVYITDSGDNTTGGAAGDNPLVMRRLLAPDIKDAVVAGIVDPEAVKQCVEAGKGADVELIIGGKMGTIFGDPLNIKGPVVI